MQVVGAPTDPADPWNVAQAGYSPDKFYLRSTDSHGHYEQIRNLKVSPEVHAQVSMHIHAGTLKPYRSFEDFVRDAIVHRLHYLTHHEPSLEQVATGEAQLARLESRVKIARERSESIRRFGELLFELERDRQYGAIIDTADELEALADAWCDTDHAAEITALVERYREAARRTMRVVN